MEETPAPDNDNPLQAEESLTLHSLCDAASEGNEDSWEKVRQWFRDHDPKEIWEEAQKLGDYSTTALHQSCRNCPPLDVIETFLKDAPEIVRWSDAFGWLPLHYACANGASEDVLRVLADAYPESKTATDRRGRTPLHFALGSTDIPVTAAAVVLLSSTGAASCPDENGMLPLHYACAYGAPEEALHVLTDNNADSITQTDRNGRTPLHFALGNADRAASPSVVKLLLHQNPDVVNITDKDRADLPLHLLATRANTLRDTQCAERENATKCLDLYLDAKPYPTAAFLAALQSLPEWLRDRAVVTSTVKNILNEKLSEPFPAFRRLFDIYWHITIIVFYVICVQKSIDQRLEFEKDETRSERVPTKWLIPLYLGAISFTVWELVQILSLKSLGLFNTWLTSAENWKDVIFFILVLFMAGVMHTGALTLRAFRYISVVFFVVLNGNMIYFLKDFYIDFAIFVNLLLYIVTHLVPFLISLLVFLIMFAQIFNTIFMDDLRYCPCIKNTTDTTTTNVTCGLDEENSEFCEFGTSLFRVFEMLLGEVNEDDFKEDGLAIFFFYLFMFLVVILLANILIAIVTDSYGVIQNERAAIVFWSNRLDFVAEVDAILSGPWKKKTGLCGNSMHHKGKKFDKLRNLWKILTDLLEDVPDDSAGFISLQVLCVTFTKVVTVMIMILWILIGFVTFGFLWPPQVREKIFKQRVAKGSNDVKEHEQRVMEIKELSKEVSDLENEIVAGMSTNWANIIAMERQLTEMREEMTTEINHIKQIMTMLFDLQAGGI
mmetsp:Transcript_987/g.1267  ORF Transcript_987/g.1267 Transcript_987/m.1267 type:complete len:778 (+) Transcript_987:61-2394(+)